MVRRLDRAMVFLSLGKPLEKLICSLMKLIYTHCLQLCDWSVRALIDVFFYFIFFYFTTQTLLFSFLLIQLRKTFPNVGTMTEQMTHRKSTRGIWASLSFSFLPYVWQSERSAWLHHQLAVWPGEGLLLSRAHLYHGKLNQMSGNCWWHWLW